MSKKLFLSKKDKKIAGVCGGIAEYFDIDSTIVRLGWVLFSLAGGAGLLGYVIAMLVIPQPPKYGTNVVDAEIIEEENNRDFKS